MKLIQLQVSPLRKEAYLIGFNEIAATAIRCTVRIWIWNSKPKMRWTNEQAREILPPISWFHVFIQNAIHFCVVEFVHRVSSFFSFFWWKTKYFFNTRLPFFLKRQHAFFIIRCYFKGWIKLKTHYLDVGTKTVFFSSTSSRRNVIF